MKLSAKCSSAIKSDTAPIVVFVIYALYILVFRNNYLLRWIDEMSLFDASSTFLDSSLHRPGGILQYIGAYLTQLLYYPSLGSCVLVILWLALAYLSTKIFRFTSKVWSLALVTPLIMLASIVHLDEAWLTMNTPGYVYAQTLGYIVSVGLFGAYRAIKPWWVRTITAAIIAALYPLFGFYALLAWLMCAVSELVLIFKDKKRLPIITVIVGAVACYCIPLIYYYNFPGTTADDQNLWLLGLPNLMYEGYDLYLWMPFVISSLLMVVFSVTSTLNIKWKHGKTISYIGLIFGLIWVMTADTRKSENFHAQVLMNYYLERQNWAKVVGIMTNGLKEERPTKSEVLLCAVATAKLGFEPITEVEVAEAPEADNPRKNENFVMTAMAIIPVEFLKGNAAKAYRWSMEHSAKYGKRVHFYKYMVKSALIAGDYKLAQKYNDILLHTMFHKKWAREYQKYIDFPSMMQDNPEFNPGDLAEPSADLFI